MGENARDPLLVPYKQSGCSLIITEAEQIIIIKGAALPWKGYKGARDNSTLGRTTIILLQLFPNGLDKVRKDWTTAKGN